LIRRLWRNGELSISQLRTIIWQLYKEKWAGDPKGGGDWVAVLECECEELDQGYRSEAQILNSIEEKLAPFAEIEACLPPWSQPHSLS
jgi:hypothetical protein